MTVTPQIQRIYLDLDGLAMFLGGELQAAVYSVVVNKPSTLKEIQQTLVDNYGNVTMTTVSTIAIRLVAKGIFKRKTERTNYGHGRGHFVYTATVDIDDLVKNSMNAAIWAFYRCHPKHFESILSKLIEDRKGVTDASIELKV